MTVHRNATAYRSGKIRAVFEPDSPVFAEGALCFQTAEIGCNLSNGDTRFVCTRPDFECTKQFVTRLVVVDGMKQ